MYLGSRMGLPLFSVFRVVTYSICSAVCLGAATPETTSVNKNRFTVLNPTPSEFMRDLSTDRPDQTESAYTVDAGHFQVEMDLMNYTRERETDAAGDTLTRTWAFASMNWKVGLLNNVDLQLMFDTHTRARVDDRVAKTKTIASGFGDVTTRLKVNLWGNDGGRTALAVMPFIKWPLPASRLRNGKTEGGIIVPVAVDLAEGWALGGMTEADFVSDAGGGYDVKWVNSITLGHEFTKRLGGYCEFVALTSRTPGFKWQGQIDIGLTYAVSDNLQLDVGCNFGATRSAPDYQPFVGVSRRF